eukprot:SAG25_NODE_2303_length_1739_cov_13.460827_3_plen_47_part_01
MAAVQGMRVRRRAPRPPLEIFTADETDVYVLVHKADRTQLLEVEVLA